MYVILSRLFKIILFKHLVLIVQSDTVWDLTYTVVDTQLIVNIVMLVCINTQQLL